MTIDAIGLDGGLNTYLYANANPIRYIDLLGLIAECGDDEDCIDKCLRTYYGDSFDLALGLSFFSLAGVAASEFSGYVAERGAAEANRNLNQGTLSKGTYRDGQRQARTVAQLRGINAASSLVAAGATGFVFGAYSYCLISCELSDE